MSCGGRLAGEKRGRREKSNKRSLLSKQGMEHLERGNELFEMQIKKVVGISAVDTLNRLGPHCPR